MAHGDSLKSEQRAFPSVVVHIPHSSTVLPPAVRQAMLLADVDLQAEILRMTDHFTDRLFRLDSLPADRIVFPVSRLAVDPERFENDDLEIMARQGMGVIYTRTAAGGELRKTPAPAERESLLNEYYRPHHARLTAAVAAVLTAHECCLIIDGHSFPSRPLPYELDQRADRPDICLGTDAFHTPPSLLDSAAAAFRCRGFAVAVDRPFAGTIVPASYYRKDKRVLSLMIEINRRLYVDEATGVPLPDFEDLRRRILSAIALFGSRC